MAVRVDMQSSIEVTEETVERTQDEVKTDNCPLDSANLPTVEFHSGLYVKFFKPLIDRTAAALGLVVLAVPMLCVAGLVWLSMGSPVFFRQRRVGLNGREFNVLKFRTMNPDRRTDVKTDLRDVPEDMRITHKSCADPRHTAIGRWMRRYSLDELPQLINVLRGQMSLVGPRPELVSVVEKHYSPELHQRHLVKPGLTGLWQLSARGEGAMHENGGWDIVYVQKVSFLTDVFIIVRTPMVIFSSRAGH